MENLVMGIEFLAFSVMVLHSRRPGYPRPAAQFAQAGASYRPVVIPAEAGIQASFNGILDFRLRRDFIDGIHFTIIFYFFS